MLVLAVVKVKSILLVVPPYTSSDMNLVPLKFSLLLYILPTVSCAHLM